jgi:hypothetical protein
MSIIKMLLDDENIDYKFKQIMNPIPDHCIDCDKPAVVKNGNTPYCIKHYKQIKEKEDESISGDKKSTT